MGSGLAREFTCIGSACYIMPVVEVHYVAAVVIIIRL
jgi:hypothetical protein